MILPILSRPDRRLRLKCEDVGAVDDDILALMRDMLETMYDAPGIGLAAIQVGVPKCVIVLDLTNETEERHPLCMANPKITWRSPVIRSIEEGCLSVPNKFKAVSRSTKVRVSYLDERNKPQELEADGLLATCLQHEIDHLDGILFIDL